MIARPGGSRSLAGELVATWPAHSRTSNRHDLKFHEDQDNLLAERPIGFPKLADDLLRTVPLFRQCAFLLPIAGDRELSHYHCQGVSQFQASPGTSSLGFLRPCPCPVLRELSRSLPRSRESDGLDRQRAEGI